METVTRFLAAVLLLFLSAMVLGITDSYGVTISNHVREVHNFHEWIAFARENSSEIRNGFLLFADGHFILKLMVLIPFFFPAFSMLLWPTMNKWHIGIFILLGLLLVFELKDLGYVVNTFSPAEEKWKSEDVFWWYELHWLLGSFCAIVTLGRLAVIRLKRRLSA
jgi:hypothetical protein